MVRTVATPTHPLWVRGGQPSPTIAATQLG